MSVKELDMLPPPPKLLLSLPPFLKLSTTIIFSIDNFIYIFKQYNKIQNPHKKTFVFIQEIKKEKKID